MSQSNYILNLLNIKDENIKLNENCLTIEKINGVDYKIISALYHTILFFVQNVGVFSIINKLMKRMDSKYLIY